MLKYSNFARETEFGPSAIPLFGKGDSVFEKTAAPTLLPEVVQYISVLRPQRDSQYVLVNAMGAGEYYGSNINGDYFTEESLIHAPSDWASNPIVDRIRAKDWPYGYPTFYLAHPYAHHRNKDASRAFGDVELAAWNPAMRRVELVTRLDRQKCLEYGGQGTWDKLKSGDFPDVSMGTKVPFDTCSICLDWKKYREAQASFDPKKHKHPGQAVLEAHKKSPIRGLSITRKDYCEHALKMMNRILPDGRKSFVYNDYPRFFDISFVFVGADKTAKVMLFIFSGGVPHSIKGEDSTDSVMTPGTKTAAVDDYLLRSAFEEHRSKLAKQKEGEIDKNVIPSQFAGKAVPLLTRCEADLPNDMMDRLSTLAPDNVLSTLGGMGVLLRPREFQRITLIQLGKRDVADDLDGRNEVFKKSEDSESMGVDPKKFMPALASLLAPLLGKRSLLAPEIERRVVVSTPDREPRLSRAPSHSADLLDKIGAAYNGYRRDVMDLVAHSQHLLSSVGLASSMQKTAASVHDIFTPLSAAYLVEAFSEEYGGSIIDQAVAGVERGSSLQRTRGAQNTYV